jgi:hypothetical protein
MSTVYGIVTYSVPQSAFGGAPAAMKNGDIVAFCAETVDSGGLRTTTITQFSDQGQPAATDTPQSRQARDRCRRQAGHTMRGLPLISVSPVVFPDQRECWV